jgi:hypothetical protein
MAFDKYRLRKWSRLVRLRDGGKCFMCQVEPSIYKLQAHHIYPKHIKKHCRRVYSLKNGITLCRRCHKRVVHAKKDNWKRYTQMFNAYMRRRDIVKFNNSNPIFKRKRK